MNQAQTYLGLFCSLLSPHWLEFSNHPAHLLSVPLTTNYQIPTKPTSSFSTQKPTHHIHVSFKPVSPSTSCSMWLVSQEILSFFGNFFTRWDGGVSSMIRLLGLGFRLWQWQGSCKGAWSFSTLWIHLCMSIAWRLWIMWLRHCVGNRLVEEAKFVFYKLKEWINQMGLLLSVWQRIFVM